MDCNLSDSEDELDFLAINQLCGEIAEGMSEGEASDLYDLQAVPQKNKSSSKKKKKLGKRKSKENL